MTISVSLGFDPIWSNFNITGIAAGGARLFSYDSLNPTVFKPIFSEPSGSFAYPQGVAFDQNGNAPGPFYFILDSMNPFSLYDLFLYDTNNNLIWNVNSYFPSSGSGGSTQTAINIQNLIINNVFWRNIGGNENLANTVSTTLGMMTQVAPGTHDGLSFNVSPTPTSLTANAFGPDIYFFKNNTSGTDIVSFPTFILGSTPFTNDVTPVQYVNHKTTIAGSAETYKYYQIPITAKVDNLSNQNVTLRIWGQGVSGTQTISLAWAQFYGDGLAATPTVITPIQTITLTPSWTPTTIPTTVPNVAGNTLGPCGNDGLFLLIRMPLTTTCEINFAKPSLYLGNISPNADFTVYDNIDAALNTPRTGDFRTSLNNFAPFGWVPANDGTIGSITSTADRKGTDTFPLYNLIWNSVLDVYAPVTGGRGLTSIADFQANKKMQLTKALGRVMAGIINTPIVRTIAGVGGNQMNVTDTTGFNVGDPIAFSTTGTLPAPLQLGVVYYVFTVVNATNIIVSTAPLGGTIITYTTAGTGINQVVLSPYVLGEIRGEETHLLAPSELANHTHNSPLGGSFVIGNVNIDNVYGGGGVGSVSATTAGVTGFPLTQAPFNVFQPTTYMNMFIKL